LKKRKGRNAKFRITIELKRIVVDQGQWFILKIAKTINNSIPMNPTI